MDSQVASYFVFAFAGLFHVRRLEHHLGILIEVKKVGALQMAVALRVAGGYGTNVQGGVNAGSLRIGVVEGERSRQTSEAAFHVRDHHVANLEFGRGVRRIEVPGGYSSR